MDRADDEHDDLRAAFASDVGPEIAAMVADPSLWEGPSAEVEERVVSTVASESGRSSPPGDETDDDSDEAGSSIADRVATWRPALLGAAAAIVLLIGGVVAFSAADGPGDAAAFSAEMEPTGLEPGVAGEVTVTETPAGLRIELDAISLPRRGGGLFYEGWLRVDDGTFVPIGTFLEGDGVVLWAGIEIERVVTMTITRERAAEPASPDQGSSGEVVLKVDFPNR